jgi:hypothetical protein
MMEEERQRQTDFIVGQRTQIATDIQQLKELQVEAEKRMTRLEPLVANSCVEMRDRFNALVNAQIKSEEKISALADAQRNLTAVVDRYFNEGRRQGRNISEAASATDFTIHTSVPAAPSRLQPAASSNSRETLRHARGARAPNW